MEYLRAATKPVKAQDIADALRYNVEFVEGILGDLKKDGKVAQLNSGRWEAMMLMPAGPRDTGVRGPRKRLPRPR